MHLLCNLLNLKFLTGSELWGRIIEVYIKSDEGILIITVISYQNPL